MRIKTLDAVTPKTAYAVFDALYTLKSGISTSDALNVWYAPGIEKVALGEPAPTASLPAVPVALARNEYEPFQLVLRPNQNLDAVQIEVGDLQTDAGQILSVNHIEVNQVGYVNVEEVTDQYGTLGPRPDPLPKLVQPFSVTANVNTPLWCTVYAPDMQPAGVYRGVVKVWAGDIVLAEVPLEVTICRYYLAKGNAYRDGPMAFLPTFPGTVHSRKSKKIRSMMNTCNSAPNVAYRPTPPRRVMVSR